MKIASGVGNSQRSGKALASMVGLGTAIIVCALASPASAAGHDFAVCGDESVATENVGSREHDAAQFALCAASTCTPTGRQITVNVTAGGTMQFPEYDCTCPVLRGPAIADLTGGNMQGSCQPPSTDQVWSLYQLRLHIPQALTDWMRGAAATRAPPLLCPASLNLGDQLVNCFSFACDLAGRINGVPVATCHCALGESTEGVAVKPNTAFLTQAGQGDSAICAEHPVSGALPAVATPP